MVINTQQFRFLGFSFQVSRVCVGVYGYWRSHSGAYEISVLVILVTKVNRNVFKGFLKEEGLCIFSFGICYLIYPQNLQLF